MDAYTGHMGAALETVAQEVGCSERTLRRYVGDGLLRGRRIVPGQLEISGEEQSYLRSHWALLSQLKGALRTERDVRLAVLFGSTAMGEDKLDSDVDVLIAHRHPDELRRAGLALRLHRALGKAVHVVGLEQAQTSPSLLADILHEGRPLIDRDSLWRTLQTTRNDVLVEAVREEQATAAEAHATIAAASADRVSSRPSDEPSAQRLSKNQRRINTILQRVPGTREQLIVAMEEFPPDFDLDRLITAAQSADARERNKVAVVEREYEVLLNWLNELAARALAEGNRWGVVEKEPGHPWERLAALGVVSRRSAQRLQEAMDMRDELGRAYPPTTWRTLHDGVHTLLSELDRYIDHLAGWAMKEEILPSS